jgi:hypothetical protein
LRYLHVYSRHSVPSTSYRHKGSSIGRIAGTNSELAIASGTINQREIYRVTVLPSSLMAFHVSWQNSWIISSSIRTNLRNADSFDGLMGAGEGE